MRETRLQRLRLDPHRICFHTTTTTHAMSQNELPLADAAPRWDVITIHHRQTRQEIAAKTPKHISHHELLFDGRVQMRKKSPGGLTTLREMAAFMNKRGMVPKSKLPDCRADDGVSVLVKPKAEVNTNLQES